MHSDDSYDKAELSLPAKPSEALRSLDEPKIEPQTGERFSRTKRPEMFLSVSVWRGQIGAIECTRHRKPRFNRAPRLIYIRRFSGIRFYARAFLAAAPERYESRVAI